MNGDRSRTLDLAARVAGSDPLADLEGTSVTVSLDTSYPGALETARILVTNLRKLPVSLSLATGSGQSAVPHVWVDELVAAAAALDPLRPLHLVRSPARDDLTVHVGPASSGAIIVVPDSHGVRLRRGGTFPTLQGGTGLGAMVAAATATAEVFKDVLKLNTYAYPRLHSHAFDPVTLGPPGKPAPLRELPAETALLGCGAIGTAIAVIVDGLGIDGAITVVDPETFDEPNVFTYSLGTLHDAAQSEHKTRLVKRALPKLDVTRFEGTALDWVARLGDSGGPWPTTVLAGVDSVQARHEIARLHADRTFDGSTGGPHGTTLSLSEARFDGPCLRCYYPSLPSPAVSAEVLLAKETGLPLARIIRGDKLTDDDLTPLSPDQRDRLAAYVNKPICGLVRQLNIGGDVTFRPSAVFVAQQAAALVVGALLRSLSNTDTGPSPTRFVQFDALLGPREGHTDTRRAAGGCVCQRDAQIIRQVRDRR